MRENAKYTINMVPVGGGDCIHIQITEPNETYNIIIDSGPSGHARKFRNLIHSVEAANQKVDLLCFTHIDNDHIKGAETLFSDPKFTFSGIDMVWINIPDDSDSTTELAAPDGSRLISCRVASKLLEGIKKKGYRYRSTVSAGTHIRLGSTEIQAVLPDCERLKAYYKYWNEKMINRKARTISASDSSPTNGASIVLLLTDGTTRMLFAGDAFAEDLQDVSLRYSGETGFDLVKLPHHGSANNITADMLQAMNCHCFLISAEQSSKRPSQESIDLLGQFGAEHGQVVLYGNHAWNHISQPGGIQIVAPLKEPVNELNPAITICAEEIK